MLAVFHKASSVVDVLKNLGVESLVTFDNEQSLKEAECTNCYACLQKMLVNKTGHISFNEAAFVPYLAESRTKEQVNFFDEVISRKNEKERAKV